MPSPPKVSDGGSPPRVNAMPFSRQVLCIMLSGVLLAFPWPGSAESGARGAAAEQGVAVSSHLVEGVVIDSVYVHLAGSDAAATDASGLRGDVSAAFGLGAGERFAIPLAEQGLRRVRALPEVRRAEYRVYTAQDAGKVIVALLISAGPAPEEPGGAKGWLGEGDWRNLPLLWEDERSKLSAYVTGGAGVFSDSNPWFGQTEAFTRGSPIATDPADGSQATWGEVYLEPGLYGIRQAGASPFYLYGDVSVMLTGALGQDLFVSQDRTHLEIEKGYVGILYAPLEDDEAPRLNLSMGRQPFQLNDGFIISRFSGSANAGERASLYLNSRVAFQQTALASLRSGDLHLQCFYLEPQELDIASAQTDTQMVGVQFRHADEEHLDAGLTCLYVPESRSAYLLSEEERAQREGLRVINPHVYLSGLNNWWFKSEYAYQEHDDLSMRAHAAYGVVGHHFKNTAGRPNLSYRYAQFGGDDPDTAVYERFDPLYSGGLAEWVQGITLKKVTANSNLSAQRVRLTVNPTDALEFRFDYFYLRALERNNRGGAAPLQNLSDKDLGHELTWTTQWQVNRNYFLLGVLSGAFPGEAIRDLEGSEHNWVTCQLALFVNY